MGFVHSILCFSQDQKLTLTVMLEDLERLIEFEAYPILLLMANASVQL